MGSSALIAILSLSVSAIICLGGVFALLKQKIIVDESGNPTSVDIPLLGKIQTNYPSLVAIFLGVALSAYVLNSTKFNPDTIELEASVTLHEGSKARDVFVGAIPSRYLKHANNISPGATGKVKISVDDVDTYSVVAFMVVKVDEDGKALYALSHGPAEIDLERDVAVYKGTIGAE